jgi:hypothetical protein
LSIEGASSFVVDLLVDKEKTQIEIYFVLLWWLLMLVVVLCGNAAASLLF